MLNLSHAEKHAEDFSSHYLRFLRHQDCHSTLQRPAANLPPQLLLDCAW